ncbi:MAG: hypothetical protein DKM50_03125 [Candidatus Margulisiibacteriota bacterium]|nr:MAG: hypothetical protein A2X43_09770 [Candidatus Margulisbacteria bacterium GWD2_39_127]OGI04588.1 MAG: hypothetical protein A2X42_07760 [Candidatus Margulisbacteria bacterium GWF2_38_17]OGI11880.1 MAG: hypothetical protein A2X41_11510 [Candidatus Margulisbacteria bacterium GWE2_39_32]PZM83109.1 MAG: hypothetical protein DKM50_03125 [Candidatus Margulisiibacteriota bacterium]HAR62223.1 hypothetical protein [Candidatus Margulisiibacteriota bacterium]
MSLLDVMTNGKNAMRAYDYALRVSSANMGQVETPGYKGLEYSFETVFNQVLSQGSSGDSLRNTGGSNPNQAGSSVAISGVKVNFEQGDIKEGGPLSAAVLGSGLFITEGDDGGYLYTRAGDFEINDSGFLVDPKGRKVFGYKIGGDGNPITSELVPIKSEGYTDLGFQYQSKSGVLINNYSSYKTAKDAGTVLPQVTQTYQLALTTFSNRSGLLQHDGTTFKETLSSGKPLPYKLANEGYGEIYANSQEKSNVFYIGETLDALGVQRAMSASLTAIKMASQQIEAITKQLGS